MSNIFNNDIVAEIQMRLDILDVVTPAVNLTRKGNRYWGHCPFHDEKTASFCVTPEKNMFYCFGCNTGGDMFTFLMKRDNLSFAEALEVLTAKAGLERVKSIPTPEKEHKKRLLAINAVVAEYYHQCLINPNNQALKYLEQRQLNQDTMDKFKLGYADEAWNSLEHYLVRKGFTAADLQLIGLIKKSEKTNNYFDIFRNRIMFPIHAANGDVVGFGGRAIDDEVMPKYLNSPESEVFSKRNNLYGLYLGLKAIRASNQIILVEGYMDCLKLHQHGIQNVVASLGTAFTHEQARIIKRYAEEVIILYDGDEAGQRETLKVIDVLTKEQVKMGVIMLPGAVDPDDYLDLHGKEGFLNFLKNNKLNYIEFKLNKFIDEINPYNIEDKITVINKIKEDISRLDSELEKDYLLKIIAQKLKIEENVIYREFKRNNHLRVAEGIKRNNKQIIRDNNIYVSYTMEERILAAAVNNRKVLDTLEANDVFSLFVDNNLRQIIEIIRKNYTTLEMEQIIRERGLESNWARIMLALEENPAKVYEINDYIRMVMRKKKQNMQQELHNQLNNIEQNGDFITMLNFILNLKNVINQTREGGI